MAENNPLTVYEHNDLHISETTDIFIQESSSDGNPLNLHDLEFDDHTVGMALSSPLFSQERENMQRAVDKLITLLTKVCSPVSRRLSVIEQGDGRRVADQFDSLIKRQRKFVSRLRE